MKTVKTLLLIPKIVVFGVTLAFAQTQVLPPTPKFYFNDYAGVTSTLAQHILDDRLAKFDKDTTNQVVVAIFPQMNSTLDQHTYTLQLANSWGVGRRDKKNGVVLFVFIKEKRMQIQVGHGLTSKLTDELSSKILDQDMKPLIAKGDFDGGLTAGVDAILQGITQGPPEVQWQRIASSRFSYAKEHYWDPANGFVMAPDPLQTRASDHDSQEIRALLAPGGIEKRTWSLFGEAYRRDQARVNNRNIKKPDVLRNRIRNSLQECLGNRGGGSHSVLLAALTLAEVEWIMRQLYISQGSAPPELNFIRKLRSAVRYWENDTGSPQDSTSFDAATDSLGAAEELMDQRQRTVFQAEVLRFFSYAGSTLTLTPTKTGNNLSEGSGAVSQAAPPTDNPKIGDLNWTRIYKIEGHRTNTHVSLSRNGSNVNGTYRQELLDNHPQYVGGSENGKTYHFSGKVEEVNGRTFIKNIQFTDSDSDLDGIFWASPDGIRWIIGESAAYDKPHRPPNALPGNEGLILTFVSGAGAQQSGEGPTFEFVLSLVHVEKLRSSTNNPQTNDSKSLHTDVLNRWLETKPEWRAATEKDYDKFIIDGYRQEGEGNGKNAVPYYVVGDFNHDGHEDFAVMLLNKKDGAFAVAVFNGPFTKESNEPAFFTNAVDKKAVIVFHGDLMVGAYATDTGFILTPTKTGYNLEYPKMGE